MAGTVSHLTFWKGLGGEFSDKRLEDVILVATTTIVDGERIHEFHDFYGDWEFDSEDPRANSDGWAPFPTMEELQQLVAKGHITELVPLNSLPTGSFNGLTLTVKAGRLDEDPPITVFRVMLKTPKGCWPETFGSVEQLRLFLMGLNTTFGLVGVFVRFSWDIPETFSEPSGVRWTISEDGISVREELNSAGEVITI